MRNFKLPPRSRWGLPSSGSYAASSGSSLPTFRDNLLVPPSRVKKGFWPLKVGSTCCPETSVRNYHYLLRNNQEERSFLQISPVHSLSTDFFKVYFNLFVPSTPWFPRLFLSFSFPTKTPYSSVVSSHTCYVYRPCLSSWLDHPDNIWWGLRISYQTWRY